MAGQPTHVIIGHQDLAHAVHCRGGISNCATCFAGNQDMHLRVQMGVEGCAVKPSTIRMKCTHVSSDGLGGRHGGEGGRVQLRVVVLGHDQSGGSTGAGHGTGGSASCRGSGTGQHGAAVAAEICSRCSALGQGSNAGGAVMLGG